MERLTYKTNGKYINTTAEQAPPYAIDCDIDTAITKLAEYEDLEERLRTLYGECDRLLEMVVEHLEHHENVDIPEPVFKARLLTDETVDKWEEIKRLDEQGKLLKLPCAVGNFALFANGVILPVVYITLSNPKEGISIGCQNGIHISMNLHYGSWCKGFFKTREEAEAALKELERGKGE